VDLAKGVKLTLAKNVDLGFHPREVGEHVAKVAAKAGGHVAKVVAKVGEHAAGRSANILTGFDICPRGGCAGKKPV
jgi:hypothetical protein